MHCLKVKKLKIMSHTYQTKKKIISHKKIKRQNYIFFNIYILQECIVKSYIISRRYLLFPDVDRWYLMPKLMQHIFWKGIENHQEQKKKKNQHQELFGVSTKQDRKPRYQHLSIGKISTEIILILNLSP